MMCESEAIVRERRLDEDYVKLQKSLALIRKIIEIPKDAIWDEAERVRRIKLVVDEVLDA